MKKLIGIIFIMFSLTSLSAKVKGYNIEKEEVIQMVYDTTKLVFSENHDEWNDIILGTLAAETDLGSYRAGSKHGIAQITPVAFKFIKQQVLKDKETYAKLKNSGLDFKKITFNELTHNHKASVVAMSLYYKYVVETKKVNIHGKDKAEVWKKYYNTYAGAGTKQHFNKAYNRNKEIIKDTLLVCKADDVNLVKDIKVEEMRNEFLASSKPLVDDLKTNVSSVKTTIEHSDNFTTFTYTVKLHKSEIIGFSYKVLNKSITKLITLRA